jgi:hypothetical protein
MLDAHFNIGANAAPLPITGCVRSYRVSSGC